MGTGASRDCFCVLPSASERFRALLCASGCFRLLPIASDCFRLRRRILGEVRGYLMGEEEEEEEGAMGEEELAAFTQWKPTTAQLNAEWQVIATDCH